MLTANDTIILKCETQKSSRDIAVKSHVWDMLLSVATTYSYKHDEYKIWSFSNKDELLSYIDTNHVVGYNCFGFDLPLLLGEGMIISEDGIVSSASKNVELCCTDIFYSILGVIYKTQFFSEIKDNMAKHPLPNKSVFTLYNMCTCTFGMDLKKNYNINSNELFRLKKILNLVEFNMMKLRLVKKCYDFICQHGFLVNGDYDIVQLKNIPSPNNVKIDDFLPF